MENEGIMGLPAGQAMQNQAPPQQPVYVSSADSYDAALQGLAQASNDPSQAAAVRQAVRESIDELALSPREVTALLDVLEYMSQNPQEYSALRQRLIDSGMMDPDDLPETYDAAYLGMAIMVLNEYQASRSEGAQAPMQMAPEVENLGPMPMAEGGLADVAQYLASLGQNGDSILAHITPAEARLLKEAGGAGTPHPVTGLPQFFLKKVFKSVKNAVKKVLRNPIVRIVATVALATVLGPAGVGVMSSAAAAATASAATTLGAGGNVKDALISAATSYFGAGGTIGGVNPAAAVANKLAFLPGGATGAVAQGVGAGVTGAGIGMLAGMKPEDALRMGAMQGLTTGATRALQNYMTGQQPSGTQGAEGEPPPADYTEGQAPVGGAAETAPAAQQVGTAPTGAVPTAAGLPAPPAMRYDPFTGRYTPSAVTQAGTGTMGQVAAMPAGGATAPGYAAPTIGGRIAQLIDKPSLETAKNVFFVNPNATTTLGRYVPAALTTVGIGALTGGFKTQPVDQNPLFNRDYTGADYIRDNPQLFGGSLGRVEGIPAPFNPFVPTPSPTLPAGTTPPVVIPRGVSLQPSGIAQPYNIAGLYGIPNLTAPVPQPIYTPPRGYAKGGSPKKVRQFPRKTGPINGPGTGTSDSIPAMLSDGEFVFTARAVRNAGGGSRRKGAKRMYALMKKLEGGPVQG